MTGMSASDSPELSRLRKKMVEECVAARGIRDPAVLRAMERVPRHLFVPVEHRHLAYSDCPLPIGQNQTISQPYIVALMSELLDLDGSETVLEIGTGSGYQAAILAYLSKKVYSLERIEELADEARRTLDSCEINNVEVIVTDGSEVIATDVTTAEATVVSGLVFIKKNGDNVDIAFGKFSGDSLTDFSLNSTDKQSYITISSEIKINSH